MNPDLNNWMQLVFRWGHVVAGVMWIGHLWFFNFVNGQYAAKIDAPTKKKVIPELMPRALFWFRWGAAYTWITGVLLLLMLYWTGPYFGTSGTSQVGPALAAFAVIVVGFAIYDQVAKAMAKQPMVSLWIWFAIAIAFS